MLGGIAGGAALGPADRVFELEDAFLTDVLAEHASVGAVGAWVRRSGVAVTCQAPVRSDHHLRMLHVIDHVRLLIQTHLRHQRRQREQKRGIAKLH